MIPQYHRKRRQEGVVDSEMEPSLLGLDWSMFVTRKHSECAGQIIFWDRPEFISYLFSALDAYATSMFAAHFSFRPLGTLNFTCRLKGSSRDTKMQLEFVTKPERGRISSGSMMFDMLRSFPRLLRTKGIEPGSVFFLEGDGCRMQFACPGRMVAELSPFLRDRPDAFWPEATLSLTPTDELRSRAQQILAFLVSSTSISDDPN
jgi:hypothetical protein